MKITYEELSKKPRTFRSFTGLTIDEFENLVPAFTSAYEAYRSAEEAKRPQTRQKRGEEGLRSGIETIRDKLLFILIHFKVSKIQEMQCMLFDMSRPQVAYWVNTLTPILKQALGKLQKPANLGESHKHKNDKKTGFITDGTERPAQRSKDFSMNKKHVVKNNLVSDRKNKKIISFHSEGKKHDKKA